MEKTFMTKQLISDIKRYEEIIKLTLGQGKINNRQFKNIDGINADGAESMFILTILEKIKKIEN